MESLTIKNWAKFQHYKHRSPPWIKLHRAILDDYGFSCLSDTTKAHLILLWVFASTTDGTVPRNPAFLKRRLNLKSEPDLETLIKQGFLIENASTTLAPCLHDAATEESREEKRREEVKSPLKRFPEKKQSDPAEVKRRYEIAAALASGDTDGAARLRDGA